MFFSYSPVFRFSLYLSFCVILPVRRPGVACAAADAEKWKAKKMIQGDKYGFYLQKRQRMEWKMKKKRQNVIKSDASTERQNENDSSAQNKECKCAFAQHTGTNRPELCSVLEIKSEEKKRRRRRREKNKLYICVSFSGAIDRMPIDTLSLFRVAYTSERSGENVRAITRLKVKNPIKFFTHLNGA